MELARNFGMRLLGPNTLGVYNADIGYYGTFSSSLDLGFPRPGNIGIASQSGAFGAHLSALARQQGLGSSVLITTGNEADIDMAEALMQYETIDAEQIADIMAGREPGPPSNWQDPDSDLPSGPNASSGETTKSRPAPDAGVGGPAEQH